MDAGQLQGTFLSHGKSVTAIDFSPDGRWIASADEGGSLKVRERETGDVIFENTFVEFQRGIRGLRFHPNKPHLAIRESAATALIRANLGHPLKEAT